MIRRPFGQRRATYDATILKRLNCFVGRYTLRRPQSPIYRGGPTGMAYWRREHSRKSSLPRYHKLGSLRTGLRTSHASRQALRAWYRSIYPSIWQKTTAMPLSSDHSDREGPRYRPPLAVFNWHDLLDWTE